MARQSPPDCGGNGGEKQRRDEGILPARPEFEVFGARSGAAESAGFERHGEEIGGAHGADDGGYEEGDVSPDTSENAAGFEVEAARLLCLDDGVGGVGEGGNKPEGEGEGKADGEGEAEPAKGGGELLHSGGGEEDEAGGDHGVDSNADGDAIEKGLAGEMEGAEAGDIRGPAKHHRPEHEAEEKEKQVEGAQTPDVSEGPAESGCCEDHGGHARRVERVVEGEQEGEGGEEAEDLRPRVEPVQRCIEVEVEVHSLARFFGIGESPCRRARPVARDC